jgi:type IV pilus assembly protein PilC
MDLVPVMSTFTYTARDIQGTTHSGSVEAETLAMAVRQLKTDGLYPVQLVESAVSLQLKPWLTRKPRQTDIVSMTSQLAVVVDAGVALSVALEGLASQAVSPALKQMLTTIEDRVKSGDDFSTALSEFPRSFDARYINLVKAGEATGHLGPILSRLAEQLQQESETRQRVQGAMMYPAAMLLMCVGACIFLLTYVFPKIAPMFAGRGIELPTATRILLTVSNSLTGYWWAWILGVIALVAANAYLLSKDWGQRLRDRLMLQLPILGPLVRKTILARIARTLSATVSAGVPVLPALELAAKVAGNRIFQDAMDDVALHVTSGQSIAQIMATNPVFPKSVVQMIAAGEQTGQLGTVLGKLSDHYDREVAVAIKSATSLIEPIMVAVMGLVIGTIALGMLLPIFKLSTHH